MTDDVATPAYPEVDPGQLDSWFAIDADGAVTVFTGRIDMGTGLRTALAQMVAEELDVAFESVTVVMGDTARTPDQGPTIASSGVSSAGTVLRGLAAQARRVLLERAAQHLDVDVSELAVRDGVVNVDSQTDRSVSYGELMADRGFETELKVANDGLFYNLFREVSGTAAPKTPDKYRIMGSSKKRREIERMVEGRFDRIHNVRVPGMVHARVVMPPAFGAHLLSVDGFSEEIPDLISVVQKGDFLGVVAESEWGAVRAMNALRVTWSEPERELELPRSDDLFDALRNYPRISTEVASAEYGEMGEATDTADLAPDFGGDVDRALEEAALVLSADYDFPCQLHASIAPSCAIAEWQDGSFTVWSGCQHPHGTRNSLADFHGIPREHVRVIWHPPAGVFGRLGVDDAAAGAVILAREVGEPVRLQWTREQEHAWAPVQPPYSITLRGGLDGDGKVTALDADMYAWTMGNESHIRDLPQLLTQRKWIPAFEDEPLDGVHTSYLDTYTVGAPGARVAADYTGIPNQRVTGYAIYPLLRPLYMRGPTVIQANFAYDSMLDELAASVGADPIEFRLRHIDPGSADGARAHEVFEVLKEKSGWESRSSPGPAATSGGRVVSGRGVAFLMNICLGNDFAGCVVDIDVDTRLGDVVVKRVVLAVDIGAVVNPDGVRNQLEGGAIMGVSRSLKEELALDTGRVTSADWSTYPILRASETPAIEITLLDRPDVPSSGVGETSTTLLPAAIGNAIFDATGGRVRRVPFTPRRVRDAIQKGQANGH